MRPKTLNLTAQSMFEVCGVWSAQSEVLFDIRTSDAQSHHTVQYSSTVSRDYEGLGFFVPIYHPQTSLIFTVTSRQDLLGIA